MLRWITISKPTPPWTGRTRGLRRAWCGTQSAPGEPYPMSGYGHSGSLMRTALNQSLARGGLPSVKYATCARTVRLKR